MAWNNNNKSNFQNLRYSPNNQGYQNQRAPFVQSNNRPLKAHSGCTFHNRTKQGEAKDFVTGWKVSKRFGMLKFIAGPFKGKENKTKEFKSTRTGDVYHTWKVKVTNEQGQEAWHSCLFYPRTSNVIIPAMGYCMVPNARRKETNGRGYVGKFGDKK